VAPGWQNYRSVSADWSTANTSPIRNLTLRMVSSSPIEKVLNVPTQVSIGRPFAPLLIVSDLAWLPFIH
jgi:hypothetical protein